jgi:hypothetical protein
MEEPTTTTDDNQHTQAATGDSPATVEGDVPMADAGAGSEPQPPESSEIKKEVKLEDLFADAADEYGDEDFPSSGESGVATPTSSQDTPSPPG